MDSAVFFLDMGSLHGHQRRSAIFLLMVLWGHEGVNTPTLISENVLEASKESMIQLLGHLLVLNLTAGGRPLALTLKLVHEFPPTVGLH